MLRLPARDLFDLVLHFGDFMDVRSFMNPPSAITSDPLTMANGLRSQNIKIKLTIERQ